ncbi:hypothetical protein A3I34_01455 [Candidatus Jorgensenbacteria bacterium RIFCSPLOWO2_02_FULL_45_12]|uniref:Uncharacterized protein n=2 Tax=Candidatus Joergenseniibacteriota TaxID=1752739 RepID=A0A1F6BP94_9BACT|nr:MAG: hypothetical protein UX22_C0003G0004 [Candidatus Jorgensenbacteria bacterium GW2011_GWA2_45_9]OGG38688.1 MAG: hypothetical protein A3D55_02325 [Candidatus Jorgensenbacteria bacterium RIFCSPHIGHO2_02_FULL_45_20]OGG42335.1 MAG: hypothetical protein A3I34_01455 [Candidatus Jorgensenbacteria bacterium RIFCSPLOWO2_02_FULL_45_12]
MEPEKDVVYFAKTDFRNADRLFGIKRTDRRQHMYVVGKTGTGKTTLLHNMMVQDILNGEGVCVIDPHGEYVESILEKIPEERMKDVIYFNPADTDYHIGFNVLELADPKYKHLVASGLMGIFTKIWSNVWSARMEYILNNTIMALLDTPGTSLLGVTRLLVDKEYRGKIINNVKDLVVKAFWVHEYEEWKDQFRNEAIAPIQNKVGQFLSTALIRNIVGQSKSTIDIFEIMNTAKIFLVNLSKGRIGEDNSALLGAMLITKMQLSAMERVRIPENERVDFFLYVDEFQNFATDSFAGILSEARKYRLNLILAHQYIGQLITDVAGRSSTKVRDAVFGNVGTMILFRVGAADAEFLEQEFGPEFMIEDMVGIPNRHIYLKLMVDGISSRPFSAATLPPFHGLKTGSVNAEEIIAASRKKYAKPKWQVEREINQWAGEIELPSAHSVLCSACGNEANVPFEPEEGRPVYCQNCLKKIKAGEMRPVFIPKTQTKKKETHSDLAALGIEFKAEETSSTAPFERRSGTNRRQQKPSPSSSARKSESASVAPQRDNMVKEEPKTDVKKINEKNLPEHTIKLSELSENETKEKRVRKTDSESVKELQSELEEALKKLGSQN